MNEVERKRVFFGCEILAPWPEVFPKGRLISPSCRHMTLAFLGDIPYFLLQEQLLKLPTPPFLVGPVGYTDQCLFLPHPSHPTVAAWHIIWFKETIKTYQLKLTEWLTFLGYRLDKRPFLSHLTLARQPFDQKEWENTFESVPMIVSGFHLYESLKDLDYRKVWSLPLLPPLEEIEHTADIAFRIRAETMEDLHLHAQIALAFKFPPLLRYIKKSAPKKSLTDIIISLNETIARADSEIGCPLKAVSFHGTCEKKNGLITWEMIVDV